MIKRILLCLLAFTMLLPMTSCKKDEEPAYAVRYNNTGITEGMYEYMYASLKRFYLDTYDDIRDNAQAWAENVTEDQTYAEYVDSKIRETIKVFVISAELYDSYGYSVGSEGQTMISTEFQSAVDYFGGEEKLSEALNENFGMTGEELRRVYEIQYKYERMLYDSGMVQADEASREEYYKEKYIRIKLIYIGTRIGYKTDEDGNIVIGGTGYETYELSEAEKAEKIAKADGIFARLEDGTLAFDDAYEDESINEFDITAYPNGLYFGRDNYAATGLLEVAETAFASQIGELKRVSDENGEFLICRYELPESAYDTPEDYTQFSDLDELCAKYKFDQRMQDLLPGAETDRTLDEKYSVTNVSPVSY